MVLLGPEVAHLFLVSEPGPPKLVMERERE